MRSLKREKRMMRSEVQKPSIPSREQKSASNTFLMQHRSKAAGGRKFGMRAMRGLAIVALGGQIRRVNDSLFFVKSQSSLGNHRVERIGSRWVCDCEDYEKRLKACKHIYAVNFLLDLPEIILSNSSGQEKVCPHCKSTNLVRRGLKYNRSGAVQVFWCKGCNKRFVDTSTGRRGGTSASLGLIALDLHFKGLSLRNIKDHLWQVYGISKPTSTIRFWIMKLTNLLMKATEGLNVEVGDKWLADEMVVKIKGNVKYLWNIMDYESRKLLASKLSDRRGANEALDVIKEAIKVAGKKPSELVTDGLKSYEKALEVMDGIKHRGNVALVDKENNNRLERLHGTIRSWLKTKRGLKSGLNIDGYAVYYNDIRPHMSVRNLNKQRLLELLNSVNI